MEISVPGSSQAKTTTSKGKNLEAGKKEAKVGSVAT
jgi:hypothetical protein